MGKGEFIFTEGKTFKDKGILGALSDLFRIPPYTELWTVFRWLLACDVVYMDFIQDWSILTVCSCPEYISDTLAKKNVVSGLYFLLLEAY